MKGWWRLGSNRNAQFDAYSDDYKDHVDNSVRFSGQSTEFFHRIKVDLLLSLLAEHHELQNTSVLDVGCGTGSLSELIAPRVMHLAGTDISAASVEQARLRVPNCEFQTYDGRSLPFADNSMDLVFTSCVMHHVPVENWSEFTSEMTRVARPGGLIAVLEHNPWNPLTRYAVSTCEFDNDAVLLTRTRTKRLLKEFGLEIVAQPYILFFPWNLKLFRMFESQLAAVPLGAQYIVVGRKQS